MRGMIKPLLGKITGRGEFFMGRGDYTLTYNLNYLKSIIFQS
jgi:hypothetical protein